MAASSGISSASVFSPLCVVYLKRGHGVSSDPIVPCQLDVPDLVGHHTLVARLQIEQERLRQADMVRSAGFLRAAIAAARTRYARHTRACDSPLEQREEVLEELVHVLLSRGREFGVVLAQHGLRPPTPGSAATNRRLQWAP
jgi:hypothetical protein